MTDPGAEELRNESVSKLLARWPEAALPRDPETDAAALLWSDERVFDLAVDNAARVRAALAQHLGRDLTLGAEAARDPRAYRWTKVAQGLVAAGADIDHHLAMFNRGWGRYADAVEVEGLRLAIDPRALDAGHAFIAPALAAGDAYQRDHAPVLATALEAVRRLVPDLFAVLRRVLRVVALKPPDAGGYDDWSEPDLPGSCCLSIARDSHPLELADHLVHELQHNRLSLIEEAGPLLVPGTDSPRYTSPWRDKPRALYGIYHGIWVFLGVLRVWRAAARDTLHGPGSAALRGLVPADPARVAARVAEIPDELRRAVDVVGTNATFTPLGRALFAELAREVAALDADPDAAGGDRA